MKTLDIIVPVFNEESCINETIKRLENVRENLNSELDVNFVFVNDGYNFFPIWLGTIIITAINTNGRIINTGTK